MEIETIEAEEGFRCEVRVIRMWFELSKADAGGEKTYMKILIVYYTGGDLNAGKKIVARWKGTWLGAMCPFDS